MEEDGGRWREEEGDEERGREERERGMGWVGVALTQSHAYL